MSTQAKVALPSVEDRLTAIELLLNKLVTLDVPTQHNQYPTSLNALLMWICPEQGIYFSIGSKRDISKKSSRYKPQIARIGHLIDVLNSRRRAREGVNNTKKRVYNTQKARRIFAEDKFKHMETLVEKVTRQWSNIDSQLQETLMQLTVERNLRKGLERDLGSTREDNARLLRRLNALEHSLRLVD